MKRGELINKGIAAASTLAFMAVVRPDPMPSLVGVALVSVLLYEAMVYSIDFVRKSQRKRKERHYITVSRADMKRLANERLYWPLTEEVQ